MSGLCGIDHELVRAGVGAHGEDRRPRLAAVGRLVDAAIAARGPERSLRRDVDDVRVARVDLDVAEVLGVRQAGSRPGLAAVRRLVDAVAEHRAPRIRVLAGAEPDDVRVLRIDLDAAEVERSAAIEDRRERDAPVHAFPQAARRRRDPVDARVLRVDVEVRDAAGDDRRTDASKLEALEDLRRQPVGGGGCLPRTGGDGQGKDGQGDDDVDTFHSSSSPSRRPLQPAQSGRLTAGAGYVVKSTANRKRSTYRYS